MLSRFFIDRPIFAWVIAIFIALAGVLAIVRLPVEQYPSIAPPQVVIQTTYPGASAETAQNSVTQVIEQQLTGIDNLMYFASTTGSTGQVQITATFLAGTNPDIAQVQVQNKVQQASSRLAAGSAAARRRRAEVAVQLSADRRHLRHDGALQQHRHLRLSRQPHRSIRSRACRASATCRCSARHTRCGSGSIRTSSFRTT